MILRAATPEDLAGMAAIQTASPEGAQWDPLGYLEHACIVAVREGKLAGFMVARKVGPGEFEILNLAVEPAARRTGVARALLHDALSRSSGTWFLEVRTSNAAAIQLYESIGFRPVGGRANYYLEPAEDAIVMRLFS